MGERKPYLYENIAWMKDGACKGSETAIFFSDEPFFIREAKLICSGCSVKKECLEYIMAHPMEGIWAGMTQKERTTLYRRKLKQQRMAGKL